MTIFPVDDSAVANRRMKNHDPLLTVYQAALAAVEGRRLVAEALASMPRPAPLRLVSIGKAAASMALGAHQTLGQAVQAGLVITKHGHGLDSLPYEILEAGHPQPDEASLRAGERLLAFIKEAGPGRDWLFLISGGASALVEVLPQGLDLEGLRQANHWLLGSGLSIDEMNRVRKGLSLIKGGRLASYLDGARVWNWLLSDVPGDDPATIGSGLLVADPVRPPGPELALPDFLTRALQRVPAAPAPDESLFRSIGTRILGNNRTALEAAAQAARGLGVPVRLHDAPLDGPVESAARRIIEALSRSPGLHLFGGETTVVLPQTPGRGGRNQHLALLLAREIMGTELAVLCAGTDGSDGPTGDAGARVDGGSRERGDLHYPGGIEAALSGFDAGTYLAESGDLLRTGPTGTNVMDLVLAYRPG